MSLNTVGVAGLPQFPVSPSPSSLGVRLSPVSRVEMKIQNPSREWGCGSGEGPYTLSVEIKYLPLELSVHNFLCVADLRHLGKEIR